MGKKRNKEEIEKAKQEKLDKQKQRQIEKENKQLAKLEKQRLKQIELENKLKEKLIKDQIQKDWLELCEYVRLEILQYNPDLKFPRYLALRLRGLHEGNFMANKKLQPLGNYDYKIILYTFKICKPKILQYFFANKTKFNDERHKINTIMVIIESNINDMVIRLKNAETAKEKAINVEMENIYHEGADYQPKTKKENNNLEDLW